MGRDKRFLPVGNRTLLDRSSMMLRQIFGAVYVVIAQDSEDLPLDIPVVRDLVSNCGSLGGLYTGLRHAKTDHVFLAACDMPFLSLDLIQYLVALKGDRDLVICRWRGQLHPTHALYSQRCYPAIEQMLRDRQLQIQSLLFNSTLRVQVVEDYEIKRIDSEGRSFLNVNTPSDLAIAQDLNCDMSGASS